MENKVGLTELQDHELKECNGGMVLSIIAAFLANNCIARIQDIYKGLRDGYELGTRI